MLQNKLLEAEMHALETLQLEVHRGSCAQDLTASETQGECLYLLPASGGFVHLGWPWLAVVTTLVLPLLSHRIQTPHPPTQTRSVLSLLSPQGQLSSWLEGPDLLQCDLSLSNLNNSICSTVLSHEAMC